MCDYTTRLSLLPPSVEFSPNRHFIPILPRGSEASLWLGGILSWLFSYSFIPVSVSIFVFCCFSVYLLHIPYAFFYQSCSYFTFTCLRVICDHSHSFRGWVIICYILVWVIIEIFINWSLEICRAQRNRWEHDTWDKLRFHFSPRGPMD